MPQLTAESQTIFAMASLANVNAGIEDTSQNLQTNAQTQIGSAIEALNALNAPNLVASNLSVVWGPVTSNSQAAPNSPMYITDNVMFVVSCNDPSQAGQTMYIVAIAGTNPASFYDWFNEDLNVAEMQPYLQNGKQVGLLAQGTYETVYSKILPMQYGTPAMTLQQFLENNTAEGQRVLVTGSSLGGALAPVVAVILKDDAKIQGNAECYPFAGPPPGDQAFATYLASRFQAGEYQPTVNPLDIVPMAWIIDNLNQIPGLYGPSSQITACDSKSPSGLPASRLVQAMVDWAIGLAQQANKNYSTTYAFPGGDLSPTILTAVGYDPSSQMVGKQTVCAFLAGADLFIRSGKSHTGSIYSLLNAIWKNQNSGELAAATGEIMALLQFLYEALMQHTEAYRSALLDPEVAAVTTAHVSLIPNASVVPIERANFLTFLQDVAQGTTP